MSGRKVLKLTVQAKVLYEELRPDEFVDRLNNCPIAYLPLGTLEWHGMHLPLGSDGIQARGFFARLAESLGGIVLPMLFLGPDSEVNKQGKDYYGMDIHSFDEDSPQQLAGSAYWINNKLYLEIIESILSNLKRAGFKIVVAHGHGPSTSLFIEHIKEFEAKFGLKLFTLWRDEEDCFGIQTDHAAFNETSLVMAVRPDLVNMKSISEDEYPLGVWGIDPRKDASGDRGEQILKENLKSIKGRLERELAGFEAGNHVMNYVNSKNKIDKDA